MAAAKSPPTSAKPVLEHFYNVKQATVRLGLATDKEEDKRGQKWLRDGVNLKGWPARRMAGQLMFSDSDLAWIADRCTNQPHGNAGRTRRPRTRSRSAVKATAA